MKLLNIIKSQKEGDSEIELINSLIRAEARIGGQIFGPVPQNIRREFFCLDRHTWVWYEEWKDERGDRQVKTTRYNIRPDGVLKSQNNQPYQRVSMEEVKNLYDATKIYFQKVRQEIYGRA